MKKITEKQRKALVSFAEDYLKSQGKIPYSRCYGQINEYTFFVTLAELSKGEQTNPLFLNLQEHVKSWCTVILRFDLSNSFRPLINADEALSKYNFATLDEATDYAGSFITPHNMVTEVLEVNPFVPPENWDIVKRGKLSLYKEYLSYKVIYEDMDTDCENSRIKKNITEIILEKTQQPIAAGSIF